MADIQTLRKAVGEVGMAEPIIAVGRAMGRAADWAEDFYRQYVASRPVAKRTTDIRLPSPRRTTRKR